MAGIAIRRLMRGEDGSVRVALVDLNTLQEVTDAQGYTILEPDNGKIEDIPISQQPKSAQVIAEPGEIPTEATTVREAKEILSGGRLDASDPATGMKGADRDTTNNFGYRNKPTGLGLASALPGPLGMAGKAINAGWNANNLAANNAARSYLGLPERSTMSNIKGVVSDVGNVVSEKANIGGTDYQVGFGGISEDGKKTQLTPDEARTRSLVMDAPIKEGAVSERGFGLRPASQTQVAPSVREKGTLGTPNVSETGTKRGSAGSIGGIEAQELGTVPDAATPESMRSMTDLSAPVGYDREVEAEQGARMDRAGAGAYGGVPSRSVETKSVGFGGAQPTDLSTSEETTASSDRSFGYSPDLSSRASTATNKASVQAGQAMTPSGFSAAGLGRQYDAAERGRMAKTLAGELNHNTLKGLIAGTPEAIAEAAAALGTIDNRVNSTIEANKANPVDAATRGSQYNANMTKPLKSGVVPSKVTEANYKKYQEVLDQVVDDYTSGKVASSVPEATHYANLDVASPAWGSKISDKIGPHTFGTPDATYTKSTGYGTAFGPRAAVEVPDAVGINQTPSKMYESTTPTGMSTPGAMGFGARTGVNSGYNPSLGGMMSDVGKSGVSSRMGVEKSFSPSSPGGMTGFGRTSVSSSLGSSGSTSKADGRKGQESYGGSAAKGGRVGSGAFGMGGGSMMGGRIGSGGFSGGSTTSSKPDGPKGQESYGGGSKSSASSGSAKGSASSASSGNSRGGMSSGQGMGGFN